MSVQKIPSHSAEYNKDSPTEKKFILSNQPPRNSSG